MRIRLSNIYLKLISINHKASWINIHSVYHQRGWKCNKYDNAESKSLWVETEKYPQPTLKAQFHVRQLILWAWWDRSFILFPFLKRSEKWSIHLYLQRIHNSLAERGLRSSKEIKKLKSEIVLLHDKTRIHTEWITQEVLWN